MIIFLDGPINAGKSTVGALLARGMPNAVHIEVDHLRHFAHCLTLEQAIPYAVSDAAILTRSWVQRGFHVIVSWPMGRSDFRRFVAEATSGGEALLCFTLLPRLEIALTDRGDRRLSDGERIRVREMYATIYGGGAPVGLVIDNSDQTPAETVEIILEHVTARPPGCPAERSAVDSADLTFILSDHLAPNDAAFIHRQIKEFNDNVSDYHRLGRRTGKNTLAVVIRSPSGALAGGLLAATYWNWLDVDELWVTDELRGKGHGRRLMQMVEEAAVGRGCSRSQVKTWEFQARGFYERLGYQVVGRQENFPPGHTLFWMRKELSHNDA